MINSSSPTTPALREILIRLLPRESLRESSPGCVANALASKTLHKDYEANFMYSHTHTGTHAGTWSLEKVADELI